MQVRPAFAPLRGLALALVTVSVVAACGSSTGPTASPRASGGASRSPGSSTLPEFSLEPSAESSALLDTTAAPAATAVAKASGTNSKETSRFKLDAGNYRVAWTISTTSAHGCNQISVLRTPTGDVSDQVATKSLAEAGTEKGQDHVTIAATATYYLSIASTCKWSISILPE